MSKKNKNKNKSQKVTLNNEVKKTEDVVKTVETKKTTEENNKVVSKKINKTVADKDKQTKIESSKKSNTEVDKAESKKIDKAKINKKEMTKANDIKAEIKKSDVDKEKTNNSEKKESKSKKDNSIADRAAKRAEEKIRKAEEKKAKEAAEKEAKEKELAEREKSGIEININLKTKHMYEFQMRHTYRRTSGVLSLAFSVGAFVYFLITRQHNEYMTNLLLVFASLMFTVIYPLQMLQRSLQLVKLSPVLSKTLNYTFTTEGILVSQDNDDALLPWENIMKVVETRRLLLVYSSPKNGYILPKAQYKEECAGIKAMIKKLVNKDICKLQLRED